MELVNTLNYLQKNILVVMNQIQLNQIKQELYLDTIKMKKLNVF
jgi:hypothetical protein